MGITSEGLDLIRAEGYPVENYYATTSDGYILNIHRIPHGKTGKRNGRVAFLQHGLLASSSDWVIAGSDKALAYVLANEGYDVWMGNLRGNRYSRNHTTLNPDKDAEFWHFSWHEMGETDLPTMIDYVLEHTGADGVYYVGHSQGTTTFFVMGSVKPEYNRKIKAHVSLAPIVFMNHMTSPLLKMVAAWHGVLTGLFEMIGVNEFLPSSKFLNFTANFCSRGLTQILCENSLFALCGYSPQEMNITLLATVMAHTPAGASTRQIMHYGQGISTGIFRRYDFGWKENRKIYGTLHPPEYELQHVTAPVYLIYSKNDWLAAESDVEKLYARLGNSKGRFLLSDYSFNHLDYTFGINAHKIVYPKVLSLFGRH
ncbi:unnamed protein product [Acanthoscelides obtectus]|uniref:Lipase n=1 Tax=Acanthoscelides obtectus TaxID=200917 RepID=A0A9P0M7L0_ACAOB|nr:unnamed protein product [Acanthoscelides obtectus]CAK1652086.1 Lipase 3 [Acanthoscelides obtectus]